MWEENSFQAVIPSDIQLELPINILNNYSTQASQVTGTQAGDASAPVYSFTPLGAGCAPCLAESDTHS